MDPRIYEKMKKVRQAENLTLKASRFLRETITHKGQTLPFKLRNYQTQMVFHTLLSKRFIIGDDTGLGKCCTFVQLIQTDDGLVKIGDMHDWSGMEPETFEPIDREWHVLVDGEKLPVKNFYYGGVKPTIKMRSRYNFEVEGSRVHPLLVWRDCEHQWVEMQDLQEGDYICVERREMSFPEVEPALDTDVTTKGNSETYELPERVTPDFARLMGYYIGEGALTSINQVRISQCPKVNPEVHADIVSLMREVLDARFTKDVSDTPDLVFNSTYVRTFLAQNGLDYVTSHGRTVPDFILRSTRASNVEFLRGLFEGEAHVLPSGGIEFSTASEELGRVVQIMLTRFGIVCNRSTKTVKGYGDNTYWRLTIFGQDARVFRDKIGFVSSRKSEALETALDRPTNPNHDVVPNYKPMVEALRAKLKQALSVSGGNTLRIGSGFKQYGTSFVNTLNHIRNAGRNPSYEFLEKFLDVCSENGLTHTPEYHALESLLGTRYFYDPVVSLEEGEEEVFDIEVDDPRHCFVSNGILNHNTLQAITTVGALWEKDPDLKVIVVTNTSVMNQWGSEIDKFTQGIDWRITKGGPEKRAELYEDYFTNWDEDRPEVLITNYHRLRRDKRIFQALAEGHRYCLVMDECFDYHTPVTLADGSTELIGKIVSQKMDVEVLSYNFETGEVEPKRVVNWYRNPRSKSRGKDIREMLKIRFAHGNSVRCTYSHDFYMLNGTKKPASDLKVGDVIVHHVQNPATEEQLQIVMGGLLGDAAVSHPDRACPGTIFCQGEDQGSYLIWKREALSSLGVSSVDIQPSSYKKTSFVHRFRVNAHPHITDRIKKADLYRSGKKRVSAEWLDKVTELGLAVWYGDDGSLKTHTTLDGEDRYQIMLHTQGFSLEENEILAGWLRCKWGVDAQVKTTSKTRGGTTTEYAYLYLPHDAAVSFLNLLPGALPGVEYKFPWHNPYELTHTPTHGVVEDRVVETRRVTMQVNEKYVYDIEVEDNHNYFAGGTLVSNCTAVKNPESQTHHVFRELSIAADRVYGLTATLIKNNLEEGFGIFRVVVPDLFRTKKGFYRNFCQTRMQRIPGSKRKIPVIVGHTKKQIADFRTAIDPYYLGRAKHEVADELPVLTTKDISMPMERSQYMYYQEAIEGLLTINANTEDEEEREVTKLTSLIYCQEIVDSPYLIGNEIKSGKEEYFLELLKEELADEKVIVFTRFKEMVNRLQGILEKDGYAVGIKESGGEWHPADKASVPKGLVRITGDESADQRDAGKRAFQDTDNTNLIFLTMAGAEAINLQEARVMVFYDLPWSAGDYLQLVGRMIRIGSPHDRVYAIHLLSETPEGYKTIDHHVRETLQKKMGYIEQALGERLVTGGEETIRTAAGSDDEDEVIKVETSNVSNLFDLLLDDAKNGEKKNDED